MCHFYELCLSYHALLQAAGRQIFVPMFHHGFAHFMPSLPLLKAGSIPALCTVCSSQGCWHGRMEPLAWPIAPDASVCCTSPLHPAALGTEPGSHFPICSTPRSPGQRCIRVMLHKQGCLNKQCEHNICFPALPIVFMEGFTQQVPPPKFKLMQGY